MKLVELKSENRQLAQHLKNMIEINSKDEAQEQRVTERVQQLEKQLMDQANQKFALVERINYLERHQTFTEVKDAQNHIQVESYSENDLDDIESILSLKPEKLQFS